MTPLNHLSVFVRGFVASIFMHKANDFIFEPPYYRARLAFNEL